jgi:hypothetical protein
MTLTFKIDKKARQSFDNYAAGKPTTGMVFVNAYEDNKEAVITKIATPLAKIFKGDYGHSLLVAFDTLTADELNRYDALANRMIPNGFSYKKLLVEDDKIFLKLKIKDNKYEGCQWLSIDEDYDFEGNVAVTFKMGLWLNFESQTSGVFLKIISLIKA